MRETLVQMIWSHVAGAALLIVLGAITLVAVRARRGGTLHRLRLAILAALVSTACGGSQQPATQEPPPPEAQADAADDAGTTPAGDAGAADAATDALVIPPDAPMPTCYAPMPTNMK